jgi:hypothetical protein
MLHTFSKVLYIIAVYRKNTTALIFQNVCQAPHAEAQHPAGKKKIPIRLLFVSDKMKTLTPYE